MSKLDEKIELYTKSAKDLNLGLDSEFIAAVTKGLGPSIYNKDAQSVSCGDSSELETVKKNFLIKKLGLEDSDKLDDAIKAVCQKMGTSNRNKYRALFYALLAKEFGKESIYA
jgi:hypothetical protein